MILMTIFKPTHFLHIYLHILSRFGALGWIRHHFEYIGDCCVRLDFSKGFNIFSFSHFTALNFTLESQSWNSVCLIYHYWAVLRITESNSKVELWNWATLSSQQSTRYQTAFKVWCDSFKKQLVSFLDNAEFTAIT